MRPEVMNRPRVIAVLSPVGNWAAIEEAAVAADAAGLDGIGFWDHYHSLAPDWAYVCGWSAYGALAARTSHVRLVPMVLNSLHYELGVLAKESSVLSIVSGGRFELGIGAGDWPESFAAWGQPFPPAEDRLARLAETAAALRRLWRGQAVTVDGSHVHLEGALSAPPPPALPRIVVGAGGSIRAVQSALAYADEINVYAEPELVARTRVALAAAGRGVGLSVFADWSWDHWPADVQGEIERWSRAGVDRLVASIGSREMPRRIEILATVSTTGA